MKRFLYTALSIAVWAGLLAYLVAATRMCSRQEEELRITSLRVTVRDSAQRKVVTPGMVRLWLHQSGVNFHGADAAGINTAEITRMVKSHLFVKDARVYTNLRGELVVELTQRKPIARVNTDNGYNFYVTDDDYILPLQAHEVVYVPVITGTFTPPFEKGYVGSLAPPEEGEKKLLENYTFISKLINFVRIIGDDGFWGPEIVQINVVEGGLEPKVEIVPRSGDHVVMLGSLSDVEVKLDKLLLFYRGALRYEGWDSYSRINIEYRDQIVCTR